MTTADVEALRALLQEVRVMRHEQREYFATRSQTHLRAAQAAERKVDRMIRELDEPREQGRLW